MAADGPGNMAKGWRGGWDCLILSVGVHCRSCSSFRSCIPSYPLSSYKHTILTSSLPPSHHIPPLHLKAEDPYAEDANNGNFIGKHPYWIVTPVYRGFIRMELRVDLVG